jgi:hypothetical protein
MEEREESGVYTDRNEGEKMGVKLMMIYLS